MCVWVHAHTHTHTHTGDSAGLVLVYFLDLTWIKEMCLQYLVNNILGIFKNRRWAFKQTTTLGVWWIYLTCIISQIECLRKVNVRLILYIYLTSFCPHLVLIVYGIIQPPLCVCLWVSTKNIICPTLCTELHVLWWFTTFIL